MNRFLTPEEAAALSQPAVQAEVARINAALCRGERSFTTKRPLFDAVRSGLESPGWVVTRDDLTTYGTLAWFKLSERAESDGALERIGAEVLAVAKDGWG